MKVVVTGAGGMLGSDVVRASSAAGHEAAGFARAELDITDERAVTARLEAERPDAVVNCAAWTDVDGAESDPTAPASAYGESKLGGERATADRNPRHFIVRSSWLFGTNGKNFVDTM